MWYNSRTRPAPLKLLTCLIAGPVALQIAEQEQSSKQAAAEEELRRSIEARMSERVKEEKLKLSKKALELGKQKVSFWIFTAKRLRVPSMRSFLKML